ncbi:hypothetical protein [Nonomuraea sp. NPDC050786]|uniref:hypothetical protein n=1 Tax=Nonomuraea sp. NPDC050786 TaxID=3154840 RepID=UPI0033F78DC9
MRDGFNEVYTNPRRVRPSNLVGVGELVPCISPVRARSYDGDLIVPAWSARYYPDSPTTGTVHMSMTDSESDFKIYVKPRLADPGYWDAPEPVAPGNVAADAATSKTTATDDGVDASSMFATPSADGEPGKTASVPVDVSEGTAFGVTGVLPPTVGVAAA